MNTEDYSDKSSDNSPLEPDLSKIETIKLLTESINKLEGIVEHLKVTSTTNNFPSTSVAYIVELTETLATTVNNIDKSVQPQKISATTSSSLAQSTSKPVKTTSTIKQPKTNNWLQTIRSNLLVTGIVTTLIIGLISTAVFWFSHSSTATKLAVKPDTIPAKNPTTFEELEKPTVPEFNNFTQREEPATVILPEVTIPSQSITVTSPDSAQTEEPATVIIPEVTIPSQPIQVTPTSPVNSLPEPQPPSAPKINEPEQKIPPKIVTAPEVPVTAEKPALTTITPEKNIPPEIVAAPEVPVTAEKPASTTITPEKNIPPEIVAAPEVPLVTETIPIKPTQTKVKPTPLPLTPEQNLVVAIQTKLSEINSQYFEDVVLSIQANFLQNDVLVKLSDRWYNLNQSEQDKLANEIFQKAQKLDFKKLEITDNNGTLIARNPIVGQQIIILQRTKDNV